MSDDALAANIELSWLEYDGVEVWRLGGNWVYLTGPAGLLEGFGYQAHVDENDAWGVGPWIPFGVGVHLKHFELQAYATAYLWVGFDEKDDFASGAEADIRLVLGTRF